MATNKPVDTMAADIEQYIKDGIAKEARKIADGYKEQIVKDVEEAMSDIVAKLSVRLSRHFRVNDLADRIEISVFKEFTDVKKR